MAQGKDVAQRAPQPQVEVAVPDHQPRFIHSSCVRALSRALHDAVDSRYPLLTASTTLWPSAFTPMAASNAALCRHSTVLHFAGRGFPESPSDSSWIFRRWWRTVCLAYSASGDWPRIPGCDPYPACAIPDATARSHRGQRQGGADSPEQVLEVRPNRLVLQSRVQLGSAARLIRVFVDVDRMPAEVVTVYRTSRVAKYWEA